MSRSIKHLTKPLFALLLLLTIAAPVGAAPLSQEMMAACETVYFVQANDTLSALAEKNLGDLFAYPAIVAATNAAAEEDNSFTTIDNPDLIEIGQKLCIPASAEMMMADDTMVADDDAMMADDTMVADDDAMMADDDTMVADDTMMADDAAMVTDDTMMADDAAMMADDDTMVADDTMMADDDAMMADDTMMTDETSFIVRIENISDSLPEGSGQATPLAPGVWAVHTTSDLLFSPGQPDRGEGLEALAEDGNPSDLAGAVAGMSGVSSSGIFNTPAGSDGPAPLLPGSSYEFTVNGIPGTHLSFATMYIQSNDLFFAPDGQGIALFDEAGNPVAGDVTARIRLWDAGTEVNEQPNIGPNQGPRQAGPNTGPAEDGPVQPVADGFSYPSTEQLIRVTISVQ